jgi:hypothetical protein
MLCHIPRQADLRCFSSSPSQLSHKSLPTHPALVSERTWAERQRSSTEAWVAGESAPGNSRHALTPRGPPAGAHRVSSRRFAEGQEGKITAPRSRGKSGGEGCGGSTAIQGVVRPSVHQNVSVLYVLPLTLFPHSVWGG